MMSAAALVIQRDDSPGASAQERPSPTPERPGSVVVQGGDPKASDPPTSYRLTYRVQDWAGGRLVETTDTITVERPYRGRIDVRRAGDKATAAPRSRTVTDFGRISIDGADAEALLVATPPALAAGDLRFDAVLSDAVAAGRLAPREQRKVGGLRCQVFRSREPLAAGTIVAEPSTDRDYTDNCLSPNGLLLEELWVTDGRVLRRRVAAAVDTSPTIVRDTFEPFGELLDPKQGGGSIRPLEPTSAPPSATTWAGLAVPEGFTFRGRYAVVPPKREEGTDEESQLNPLDAPERKRVGAVVDVWERGVDVLVLEQGGAVDGTAVFALEPGEATFDVVGLGTGQVVLDGRLSELRFPLPDGRYVRVLGTVPADVLRSAASTLQVAGEGTGLVFLDQPPP